MSQDKREELDAVLNDVLGSLIRAAELYGEIQDLSNIERLDDVFGTIEDLYLDNARTYNMKELH